MTASIGQLSVGVSLDLAPMEKDAKKMRAQLKQLDKEQQRLSSGRGPFGQSGFGSGYGRSPRAGAVGRRSIDQAMNPFAGPGAGGLIRSFGGQAIGRSLAGGGALAGAGSAGGVAAGVALVFTMQKAVANFAKESGKLDDATISVRNYGDALADIGKKVKDTAMGFAVEGLGIFTQIGNFIGSDFSREKMWAANDSDRAALTAEQRTADLVALNGGGTTAEAIARRQEISRRIKDFQRDQRFNASSPKQQQSILADEIKSLKVQEDKARVARKFIEADTLRLDRLKKEAELEKNIVDFKQAQAENEEAIAAFKKKQKDDKEKADAAAEAESRKTLEEVFRATDAAAALVGIDRIREQAGRLINPFGGSSVVGFGSAVTPSGNQQGMDRILAEQLRVMKRSEELLEDIAFHATR